MVIVDSLPHPRQLPPTAVALGLFDGLHRGHQAVIRRAVGVPGLTPAVFTFRYDEEAVITKKNYARLLSPALKMKLLEQLGARIVFQPPFSKIMSMEPAEFFYKIIVQFMRAGAVVCGEDFRFGKNAAGDALLLRKLCEENGIRFTTVPPVEDEGKPVSSTRIREALRQGDVETANRLLGYPFMTDGTVVHGQHMGHALGFPTINQLFQPGQLIPRFGVYATIAEFEGRRYIGATDIGVKPTVGDSFQPAAETHLLDFDREIYGAEGHPLLLRLPAGGAEVPVAVGADRNGARQRRTGAGAAERQDIKTRPEMEFRPCFFELYDR